MTATTPNRAYPYPEGTDFLGDTAAQVQALAEAIDDDVDALPRGEIATDTETSNTLGIGGTATDVLSVSPTLAAGRRIRVTGKVTVKQTTTGLAFVQLRDGSGTVLDETFHSLSAGEFGTLVIDYTFTSAAGALTLKASLLASPGALETTLGATRIARLTLEDVGAA